MISPKNFVRRPRTSIYLGALIILLVLPNIVPIHQLLLIESGITFAILGLGFNLLLRYTGLLSFGHGALFATGAYAVGLMGLYLPEYYRLEILIPAAIIISAAISAIFGLICVRNTRVFFAILALAVSMIIFAILVKFYDFTGGTDGIHIDLPIILGTSYEGVKRFEFLSGRFYYILVLIFIVCTLAMLLIVNSPFGKALQSVRDNEVRAEMIGLRVNRLRLYAFILSGLFAGIAGALWSFVNGHVTPEIAEWVFSGEIVYMTLLGGFMVFEGPIVGALLFTYLKLYAVSMTEYWMSIIGATLILMVLLLPEGITGGLIKLGLKIKRGPMGENHARR